MVDPVGYVRDVQEYLGEELVRVSKSNGGQGGAQLRALLGAADPTGGFVMALGRAGYVL